ncbi:GNAT family N-acetyltransferase [Demequina globuliformis]|uniref:GNAT family N-acetyltransferase n=1 Tax=Demequina globuliformis TaxID=676202 RepID=UPI0007803D1D|nr:GNAT family protein [Demequina globuliformis]
MTASTAHFPYALRPLVAGDAADVLAAFTSHPDMARQGDVASFADADRYIAGLTAPGSRHCPWAIENEGHLVGLVCVTVDAVNRSGWFWYWMRADARGKGVMQRAAATVAAWALEAGGLERLELGHRVNNPASGAVARAAGFVQEGTERGKFLIDGVRVDVDTYGRLQSDPHPSTPHLLLSSH